MGIPAEICPHIGRHEFISRLFENTTLNLSDSAIAALVGDVNPASLAPYKHLQVEALRGKQDEHRESLRATLDAVRASSQENLRLQAEKDIASIISLRAGGGGIVNKEIDRLLAERQEVCERILNPLL